MNATRLIALVTMVGLSGCVTTTTRSTTWGEDPYAQPAPQQWERRGRVEGVRETVQTQQGNPAGGAVAGAVVGGLLGHAMLGNGGGLFGAVSGAAVGAAASSGQGESRYYELFVRFDDGGTQTFVYQGPPPFRPGEYVVQTPQGLYRQ